MNTNFTNYEDNSMKKTIGLFVQKAFHDQRGQILPWLAVVLIGMLGAAGLSIDVGRAYVAHSQLQNYANAAALAAAGEVYNTSTTTGAIATATSYSAGSGDENASSSLGTVTTTVTTVCVNALEPAGSNCTTSPTANAVRVNQTTTIPTYFMKLFGIPSLSVSSQSMASMQGAAQPWNVAIILDATQSMGSAPPSGSCTGYSTLFACAQGGVQSLLQAVQPCAGGASCTASNTQFRVALFSFPNVSVATVGDVYGNCNTPTNEPYTLPLTTGYSNESTTLTSYTNLGYATASTSTSHGVTTTTYTSTIPVSTYEDTPVNTSWSSDGDTNGFSSDYWSASATGNLNTSSSLVKAVTGCMKNPGGESTYYASVIYAAQAALTAEQTKYGGKNAIIILSDGEANAANTKFPSSSNVPASGQTSQASYGFSVATNSTSSNFNNLNTTGTTTKTFGYYPDFHDECQQAIMASQAAQAAGTTVFAVGFGSETTTGCSSGSGSTDTTVVADQTGTTTPFSSASSITPCITMKNIASPTSNGVSYFYADSSSSTNGCTDNAHTVSQVNQIFWAISSYFTTPRLIPSNTAYTAISQ
jgi:Flp pilus assembly protein TadG